MNNNSPGRSFSIVGIYIYENCAYRKILAPGYYPLNNSWKYNGDGNIIENNEKQLSSNFFDSNISISAIVGKNGSGKSSLLDTIYRIMNNFWYGLIGDIDTPKESNLHKVDFIGRRDLKPEEYLNADLYFVIDGKKGRLSCKSKKYELEFFDKKLTPLVLGDNPEVKLKAIVDFFKKYFFYTIVSNYSLQSFISKDYEYENIGSDIWINKLFHKNDAYSMPIVLNPYRDNGVMDLNNEYDLTNDRLTSILIETSKQKKVNESIAEFIENYSLLDIEYDFNPYKVILKYMSKDEIEDFNREKQKVLFDKNDYFAEKTKLKIEKFKNALSKGEENNSFVYHVLKELKLINNDLLKSDNVHYIIAHMYIVEKVFSIMHRYSGFGPRVILGAGISAAYNGSIEKLGLEKEDIVNSIANINADQSHITLKVKRTENFIKTVLAKLIKKGRENKFSYIDYLEDTSLTLDEILNSLPPSFYKSTITLKRNDGEEIILFNKLSSGERQFIYVITTLIYHVKNLISVPESDQMRFKYNNINIICSAPH